MVRIIIEDKPKSVQVGGDLMTVVAEIGYAVGTIYSELKNYGDPNAAELFNMAMFATMTPDSPTWDVALEGVSIVRATEKSGTPTDQS